MAGKHFVDGGNHSELVVDALQSLVSQHPGLVLDKANKSEPYGAST